MSNLQFIQKSVPETEKENEPEPEKGKGKGKRKAYIGEGANDKGGRPKKQKKKKKLQKKENVPLVHCSDLNGFIEKVIEERKLPNRETLLIKFGVDEGQSLLKVVLSVIHLTAQLQPGSKLKIMEKFKDSGVMKLFVVAVTPGKETADNMQLLFQRLNIQRLNYPFKIAADLKAMGALCGLSTTATATCPCPGCLWKKKSGAQGGFQLRTWGMAVDDYNRWKLETGGKTLLNKNYHNVNHLPIPIYKSPDSLVLDMFCFPTVHILTGVFNHMHDELEKLVPGIIYWSKLIHVKQEDYNGKMFQVNE